MSDVRLRAAFVEEDRRSFRSAFWIPLVLAAALSWPDQTAVAGSPDPATMVRILHSANGKGEISPCG